MVGLTAIKLPGFKNKAMWFFVSFAGGVMLGNAFFDLLPESLGNSNDLLILNFALFGIVAFFLMEKYFLWHCHAFGVHSHKSTSFLVMFGDTLHNFIDGVVIAGAFLASPVLGVTTTLAIALHEVPQEVADFSILLSDGIKPRRAILLNFLSGFVALFGGIAGYIFLEAVQGLVPYFTAFASGMFIYIACSDIIPRTHERDKNKFDIKTAASFLAGLALIKGLSFILH